MRRTATANRPTATPTINQLVPVMVPSITLPGGPETATDTGVKVGSSLATVVEALGGNGKVRAAEDVGSTLPETGSARVVAIGETVAGGGINAPNLMTVAVACEVEIAVAVAVAIGAVAGRIGVGVCTA